MSVLRPDLMMKCVVPVIMAGIIAIVSRSRWVSLVHVRERSKFGFEGGMHGGLAVPLGKEYRGISHVATLNRWAISAGVLADRGCIGEWSCKSTSSATADTRQDVLPRPTSVENRDRTGSVLSTCASTSKAISSLRFHQFHIQCYTANSVPYSTVSSSPSSSPVIVSPFTIPLIKAKPNPTMPASPITHAPLHRFHPARRRSLRRARRSRCRIRYRHRR